MCSDTGFQPASIKHRKERGLQTPFGTLIGATAVTRRRYRFVVAFCGLESHSMFAYQHRLLTVTSLAVFVFVPCAWADIDLETALTAHESTIDSLISFEMRLDVYAPSPSIAHNLAAVARGADIALALFQSYRWIVDGRKERVQVSPVALGDSDFREDVVRDGSVEKVIMNWDWHNPPRISPSQQGRVRAHILPQTDNFQRRDPAQPALIYPRFHLSEPRMKLRQFIGRFRDISTHDDGQNVVVTLRGDRLGFYKGGEQVTLTLSKSHGFLIRRMVNERVDPVPVKEYGKSWRRLQFEVTSFQTVGEGAIPFPKTVRYSVFDAYKGDEVAFSLNSFTCVSANSAIPPESLTLTFPKDVLVVDLAEDPTKAKWYLMGDQGKRIPIRSRDELALYDHSTFATGRGRPWVIAINAVIFVIVVSTLLLRRTWRRKT